MTQATGKRSWIHEPYLTMIAESPRGQCKGWSAGPSDCAIIAPQFIFPLDMHETLLAGGAWGVTAVLGWLMLIAFVAGATKGLTGFGAALVMAPLFGLFLPVPQATVLIVLLHCVTSLQDVRHWARLVQWRTVMPFAFVALTVTAACAPLVASIDAAALRHGVGLVVIATTLLHINGWRWRHDAGWGPVCAAGVASGVLTAIGGLGGPPAVYYLGGLPQDRAQGPDDERIRVTTLRANLLAYFAVLFTGFSVALALNRRIGLPQMVSAALLTPVFALGAWAGGRLCRRLPERWFDGLVSGLLLGSGLLALAS
jgi:uncharacterized membrane protein YfcA